MVTFPVHYPLGPPYALLDIGGGTIHTWLCDVALAAPKACASALSVTCPTFMGRPANSNPFICSSAFFASSDSTNWKQMGPHIYA